MMAAPYMQGIGQRIDKEVMHTRDGDLCSICFHEGQRGHLSSGIVIFCRHCLPLCPSCTQMEQDLPSLNYHLLFSSLANAWLHAGSCLGLSALIYWLTRLTCLGCGSRLGSLSSLGGLGCHCCPQAQCSMLIVVTCLRVCCMVGDCLFLAGHLCLFSLSTPSARSFRERGLVSFFRHKLQMPQVGNCCPAVSLSLPNEAVLVLRLAPYRRYPKSPTAMVALDLPSIVFLAIRNCHGLLSRSQGNTSGIQGFQCPCLQCNSGLHQLVLDIIMYMRSCKLCISSGHSVAIHPRS